MPNKHLEHAEDLILTGETWVVDAMFGQSTSSLKMDGAPAIVWGTHPETGEFFVGTKSVFNKRLIKINYTHDDINKNHPQEGLQQVLHACLDHIPHCEGVYQGDFIGFAGSQQYTPNTLTYEFNEIVTADIIIAPHTQYHIPGAMCDAEASPLTDDLFSTDNCKFVQPIVDRLPHPQENVWNVPSDGFEWLTEKQAVFAKQEINKVLKSGRELSVENLAPFLGDDLARLYYLVMSLKYDTMDKYIVYDTPKCTLNGEITQGEGFVMTYKGKSFKLVDRYTFSYANFGGGKFCK